MKVFGGCLDCIIRPKLHGLRDISKLLCFITRDKKKIKIFLNHAQISKFEVLNYTNLFIFPKKRFRDSRKKKQKSQER